MNNKLESLVAQLKSAADRFDEVLKLEKTIFMRDSAIQRFEFTCELAWKTMKAYLQEKGAKDIFFPKDVIKSAYQARIINNDLSWLDMIDTRNETSHMYKESMAEDVYKKLPDYLPLIKDLVKELS